VNWKKNRKAGGGVVDEDRKFPHLAPRSRRSERLTIGGEMVPSGVGEGAEKRKIGGSTGKKREVAK